MNLSKYAQQPNAAVPEEIDQHLHCPSDIHLTEFADKNTLLTDHALQKEIGYRQFPNGDYLVAMICPMPHVTKEMIDWWFW